jgi:hypothetical protein
VKHVNIPRAPRRPRTTDLTLKCRGKAEKAAVNGHASSLGCWLSYKLAEIALLFGVAYSWELWIWRGRQSLFLARVGIPNCFVSPISPTRTGWIIEGGKLANVLRFTTKIIIDPSLKVVVPNSTRMCENGDTVDGSMCAPINHLLTYHLQMSRCSERNERFGGHTMGTCVIAWLYYS